MANRLISWARSVRGREQEEPDSGEGKCMHCGFLCKMRTEQGVPVTFYPIDYLERGAGRAWEHVDEAGKELGTGPWCFQQVPELLDVATNLSRTLADAYKEAKGDDFDALTEKADEQQRKDTVAAFEEDRECSEWIKFVPGLDPEAHLGMKGMQDAERRAMTVANRQSLLALAEVTLAFAAVIVAVILAVLFTGGSGDTINNYIGPTPPAIVVPLLPPSDAEPMLTPIPSPESVPDTALPQPQLTP